MGTNYYLVPIPDTCPCCNRPHDRLHIGKKSAGWQFSFRGYRRQYREDDLNVLSFSDWQDMFATWNNGQSRIVNEYEDQIEKYDFVRIVRSSQNEPMNLYDYCQDNHPYSMKDRWKDEDGYSFSDIEFS